MSVACDVWRVTLLQGSLADFLVSGSDSGGASASSDSVSEASDDGCVGRGLLPSRRRTAVKGAGDGMIEDDGGGKRSRRQRRPSMRNVYVKSLNHCNFVTTRADT